MKIQSINNNYNQNKVSHKAHFKPNMYLKELCDVAEKNEKLISYLDTFQKELPKHEIEIVSKTKTNLKNVYLYKLMNNKTYKEYNVASSQNEDGLVGLISGIFFAAQSTKFFEEKPCELTNSYGFLTNTEYEPEIKENIHEKFTNGMRNLSKGIVENK
ncbi:MAG: hypothetical protein E7Z89_02310 [Cyanobacteria bacterium SIG28]|nr:hypothetical protein [Cyanobacteria bacterium SIG28]